MARVALQRYKGAQVQEYNINMAGIAIER